MEKGIIKELRKKRELSNLTANAIGSMVGYEVGRKINPDFPVVPMILGGLLARMAMEYLLSE